MTLQISFVGAAGTVTGSRYLIEDNRHRVLVDCGLFQGFKGLRLKNWIPFPVDPRSVGAILLTHAHIDHAGYIPLIAKNDFRNKVFCSKATEELCGILLPDAGHLEEKYAEFANCHGFSKHKPALPLFTEDDARDSLRLLRSLDFGRWRPLNDAMEFRLQRAGHIIGAASIELRCGGTTILFSGDLGRFNDPIMPAPEMIQPADYLICESTYGNRLHAERNPEDSPAEAVATTIAAGGTVLIPAFAVGRAQSILYYLHRLKKSGRISASLPVYLDSPMAQDASDIFVRHTEDHRLSERHAKEFCGSAIYVRDVDASKALTRSDEPKVILSASGMATGGRILHHLKRYAPDPKNAILFARFQAGGTRGAAMVAGTKTVKIHGEYVPIRAKVTQMEELSAHADAGEILHWLKQSPNAPRRTFITHGEPSESDGLRHRIEEELRWNCAVPELGATERLL